MFVSVALAGASLCIILLGAKLFTNGIEWLGKKLNLSEGAVGSVLAAVGTALPETMIPVVAILMAHGQTSDDIGIGAILGAPLMLSTVGFFVTGVAALSCARRRGGSRDMRADPVVLARDLRFFVIVFAVSIGASFIRDSAHRVPVAILLVLTYVLYVVLTFRHREHVDTEEEIGPLSFDPHSHPPHVWPIVRQVIMSLGLIVAGAHMFVEHIEHIAEATGVSALVLSLVIAPIATELPEKFNSVIWVREGKDTLALGNMSGAMVFQSSIPTAIGIAFTEWHLTQRALAAGLAGLVAGSLLGMQLWFRGRVTALGLMVGIVWYAGFLTYVLRA